MKNETCEQIALHRYGVIAEALPARLTGAERGDIVRRIASRVHGHPDGTDRRLGRTIARWAEQIVAWHQSHVTNGPTEVVNNLAKRIKRVAFGLVNFRHHRVRCLLYAGKPDCGPSYQQSNPETRRATNLRSYVVQARRNTWTPTSSSHEPC